MASARQQIFARGKIVQVDQLLAGEGRIDFGERSGFGAIDADEAEKQEG